MADHLSFCLDEHVPRVFAKTLRSSGYTTVRTKNAYGAGTTDRELLEECAAADHVLITNDKKDFSGVVGSSVDHAGLIIYTDEAWVREQPENTVRTIERVLTYYDRDSLRGETIWLDQWS